MMLFKQIEDIRQQRLRNDAKVIKKMIDIELNNRIKLSVQKYKEFLPLNVVQESNQKANN